MEPTATPASGWEILFFFVGVVLWPVVWRYIASRQRKYGKKGLVAHLMGAAAGFCVFFSIVFILVAFSSDTGWIGAYGFAIFTLWGLRAWTSPPKDKTPRTVPDKPASNALAARNDIYTGAPTDYEGEGSDLIRKFANKPSAEEQALIDQSRIESIMASKRAGATRKKDMKSRGEQIGEPIWMEEFRRENRKLIEKESRSSGSRQRKSKKVAVTGSISFDYMDIDLNYSSRVVDVTQVDDRHFSGYCRSSRAFRTFLISGVQSDVTDTDTGEVMSIDDWIESASQSALKK
ncbi:hypothetical protein [Azonexus hydrophilus]|uniref:WYL domain-containing protein n=1 Tax=Azonexus hydrophilus TaxID=418702 RepID=A0ABZ2XCE1_9RHOO